MAYFELSELVVGQQIGIAFDRNYNRTRYLPATVLKVNKTRVTVSWKMSNGEETTDVFTMRNHRLGDSGTNFYRGPALISYEALQHGIAINRNRIAAERRRAIRDDLLSKLADAAKYDRNESFAALLEQLNQQEYAP